MNDDEFAQMNIEDFPTIHMIDGLIDEALKDDTVAPNGLSVSSLDASSVGLSGCSLAVVSLVANTLSLLLSFLGISVEIAAVEGEVIALLASDGKFLPSVVEAVSGFRNANGWDRAVLIFKAARLLNNSGLLLRAVKKAVSHLPWWKKAQIIVTATATIALWFGTEGFALVAQIALAVTTLPSLVESAIDVTNECIIDS